jgi:L-threonylcarbamoyladenylate synthase
MKYAHYAPEGEMWLVSGNPEAVPEKMKELLANAKRQGRKTGVLAMAETAACWERDPDADIVVACGSGSDLSSVAQHLYASLRMFDDFGVQFIVAAAVPRTGMGLAVMNRLEKAAGGRVLNA